MKNFFLFSFWSCRAFCCCCTNSVEFNYRKRISIVCTIFISILHTWTAPNITEKKNQRRHTISNFTLQCPMALCFLNIFSNFLSNIERYLKCQKSIQSSSNLIVLYSVDRSQQINWTSWKCLLPNQLELEQSKIKLFKGNLIETGVKLALKMSCGC